MTTESTFDERTADFFVDVHGLDKLIIPVVGSQKGEANPRALIDGFQESLKRHKAIEWSPEYAIHVGMLDPGELTNPSPASCKPVAGLGQVDLSQADYRAMVKVNVWKRTAQDKLASSIEALDSRQTEVRKSVDTANKLAIMTGQSADAILRSSFPLGLLTGIVWQEIMQSCDPITRRLLRYQTRFGVHLKRQAARITDSLNVLRQRPPEVNQREAEATQTKRFNDILAEWQKKRTTCLTQAGFSTAETQETQAAKTLMRYFEENYGDHAKKILFEQDVRGHARRWLENTRRRRTVRFAFLMVSSAVPLVIIVLALLPGFLATEFILAAFLSPAVVEALRNFLLPVIDPVEKAWIAREKPAIIRILNAIPSDDAARRLGMATQMANCLATFKQTAETALANVERINPVPARQATNRTQN